MTSEQGRFHPMPLATLDGDITQLRMLVDAVPVPCSITTRGEGRFLARNKYLEELLGIPEDTEDSDLRSTQFYADPGIRAMFLERIAQDGGLRDAEFPVVCSDGTRVDCIGSFQAATWRGEDVLVTCVIDVTRHKGTELALRASEEKFREIAENTSDVIWHAGLDLSLTYIGGGAALIDWLGTPELLGRNALELCAPESIPALKSAWIDRIAREQAGERTGRTRHETRLLNAKEERLWVELTVYPHRDLDGRLSGYFGIMRDISERRRAEDALRHSETLFRQMFDASPVSELLVDPESLVIVNANASAASFHGLEPAALTGLSLADLIVPTGRDDGDPLTLLREIGNDQGGHGGPVELTHRRADGSLRRMSVHVGALDASAPDGTPRRYLNLSLFDVTDRERYALALEHRNADLRDFTAAVSHDLQEPLRLVTSYLGLLERRLGDRLGGDEREFIGFAVDGAVRMRSMIQSLLDYARLDSNVLEPQPVSLQDVLELVQGILRAAVFEAGAVVRVADPLPVVMADRRQIASLFQNLIANAVRYRRPDEDCLITITWERHEDSATISVSDTGIGIDPNNQERVFGVFQRLRRTGDETDTGTGMGLAICRRIVERHGGRIWAVSPGENQGTTFRFTLPLAVPAVDAGASNAR
jgi:PAS domain S-box-containing protein